MSEIIKNLTKPWERSDIKWRVGSTNQKKGTKERPTKALPLAYIDARTVMDRLDAVVGAANWQDRYEFHGTRTICYLSIRINNEWICKSDGAGDSDIESEKGGISDAFKRASVKWGMGRELYELKCKWMPINTYRQLEGDPWNFVIKGAYEDEKEPDEVEEAYELCKKQMLLLQTKSEFGAMWNSIESKNRRAFIKKNNEVYYNDLIHLKDQALLNFEDDENKLLEEYKAI